MVMARHHLISTTTTTGIGITTKEQEEGSDDDSSSTQLLLYKQIRKAYEENETDGILMLAQQILLNNNGKDLLSPSPEEIVSASLEATKHDARKTSGIINAFIGSCCLILNKQQQQQLNDGGFKKEDYSNLAFLAYNLLQEFEEVSKDVNIYPDMVTFCSTYTALCLGVDSTSKEEEKNELENLAEEVLKKAQQYSKKKGGNKYRRALAAASRRSGSPNISKKKKKNDDDSSDSFARDIEQELQSLYGNDFQVLYEDESLLILSKPSGMVCFHKNKTTAGKLNSEKRKQLREKQLRNKSSGGSSRDMDNDDTKKKKRRKKDTAIDISLEDALLDFNIPLSTLNYEGRGIVHRLDRGTSGCIILAKNDDMHAKLVAEFFVRGVKKDYMALIPFYCQQQQKLLPQENGESASGDDDNNDGDDIIVRGGLKESGEINIPVHGRPAQSFYQLLETFGTTTGDDGSSNNDGQQNDNPTTALIKVETRTGRKHQVRVHCAKGLGRPIYLDPLYSASLMDTPQKQKQQNKKASKQRKNANSKSDDKDDDNHTPQCILDLTNDSDGAEQQQFFLHASSISIPHFGILNVKAPLPTWWEDVLNCLKREEKN